jgi:mevalonate kinase
MQLKASAPGSLMLLGEYAVLHGKHALVCAVDKRITVTLTPRADEVINIHSDRHGVYTTNISHLTIEKPFHYVLTALKHHQTKLKRGCDIEIQSEFSDTLGLGSSAAVTVATLSVLVSWLGMPFLPLDLVRQGRNIVREVQGVGSGADVAASVYGGMVGYQAQPLTAEKISITHPLTVIYSGHKTPTPEAIARVQDYFSAYPNIFRELTNSIGQCAQEGLLCARKAEWKKLGEIMNMQQGLMESLGVGTDLMREMIFDLRKQDTITGAKISGSGFGDCVIGLGETPAHYTYANLQRIPVAISLQGVHCEKI